MRAARLAADNAYAPYSKFRVGAAVLVGDGSIHCGCNVENASYGLTMCAERNAVFRAVSAGHRTIERIALSCADVDEGAPPAFCMPCGACRQVIAEFAPPTTVIEVDGAGEFTLEELLPSAFRL